MKRTLGVETGLNVQGPLYLNEEQTVSIKDTDGDIVFNDDTHTDVSLSSITQSINTLTVLTNKAIKLAKAGL